MSATPQPILKPSRRRSALWTVLLLPFFFLPYRWLWLPCGLGTACIVWPGKLTLRQVVRRDGTLIFGSGSLLILRMALDPAWWLPWTVVLAALVWLRGRSWWSRRLALAGVPFVCVVAVLLLSGVDPLTLFDRPRGGGIRPDAVVVCAGDSLTAGLDSRSDANTYVAELRRRLGCKVVNAGVCNDKAGDLLAGIDKTVLAHQPDVVLLFIGGNDYFDGTPRELFRHQLDSITARLAASDAGLILVEVPTGIVWNPYAGLYRHLARRYHATLTPESHLRCLFVVELSIRSWLTDPMTLDGIHLSPAGARNVADWLEPYARDALARAGRTAP